MDLGKWQSSPAYLSVRDITNGDDVPYKSKLSGVLHTVEHDYKIFKILSQHIVRDYNETMMDDVQVKIMVPLGDYIYLVYPNKDNLEMTIRKTPLNSMGSGENSASSIEETRYKCVFDTTNPSFTGTEFANYNQSTLNNTQFVDIKMKLMDRNVEPLRIKTVQGIFRGVSSSELIKSILLGESQNILIDGSPAVSGMDMVEPDNQIPNDQIILSSGTYICEVPTILQERYNGIYKYGIGTYYQRYNKNTPTWFIFPLFDFDRFDGGGEKNIAIFYSAPSKYTMGIERTYRVKSGVLEVIVSSEKHQMNVSDVTQLNEGVGFRMVDTAAFMKKPVMIDETGSAVGARGNLNREVAFINRKDGLNHTPVVRNYSTNSYHETSKISARQATILQFGWENADESLIYPGMPMKYCYMQNNEFCELKGTILGIHSIRTRQGTIAEDDRYLTKCILSIATELNTQLPSFDKGDSLDR